MSLSLRTLPWVAVALICSAATAGAETLETALSAVYETNPTLNAERAHLRAVDEELAKAQSGFRPQIGVNADLGVAAQNSNVLLPTNADGSPVSPYTAAQNRAGFKRYDGVTKPSGLALVISQPLFDGFQTRNLVRQADAGILAERQTLLDTEQRTLLQAISAYMDVMRDSATVRLRQNSLKLIGSEAKASQDRFAAGDVTRTDVSQAQARQAEARGNLEVAKANLRSSLANYQRLVGHVPSQLTAPRNIDRLLPSRVEDVVAAAVEHNPQVLAAAYTEKASGFAVQKTLGEMLPQISFQAQHSERYDPSTVLSQQMTESALVRVNMPIYQAGDVEARVRQAKQERQGHIQEIASARQLSRAQALSTFAELQANRAQLVATRQQVQSLSQSVSGMRAEQKAGQRTLLDVLNVEQELINAQVSAVIARHDLVVTSFTLLAAMGRLTAADLGLGVAHYDETKHYDAINGKWGGTAVDVDPAVGAQNADWSADVQARP